MTRIILTLTLALGTAVHAPAADAQAPAYARSPADTLQYRETRQTTLRTEGDTAAAVHRRDVRLSLWFTGGDGAGARYRSLSVSAVAADHSERMSVPGRQMRGLFALDVSREGRVRTREMQRFPEVLGSDLDSVSAWQFADFLPLLPAEPLRPGLEWTDADSFALALPGGPRLRWTRATRSRVAGDTVIGGRAAVLVRTEADVGMRYDTKYGALLHAELRGTERGRFAFAPEGVLLLRERAGRLEGTVRVSQQGVPGRTLAHTQDYTVTLRLLTEPDPDPESESASDSAP